MKRRTSAAGPVHVPRATWWHVRRGRRRGFAGLALKGPADEPLAPGRFISRSFVTRCDVHGRPLDLGAWAFLFEHGDRDRFLWKTDVGAGRHVSTIWTGLFPCFFESAMFGPEGLVAIIDRYDTKREARRGHEHAVLVARGAVRLATSAAAAAP